MLQYFVNIDTVYPAEPAKKLAIASEFQIKGLYQVDELIKLWMAKQFAGKYIQIFPKIIHCSPTSKNRYTEWIQNAFE